jgi:hypothetical protein
MQIGKSEHITARDFLGCAGHLSCRQNSICLVHSRGKQHDQFARKRHTEMQKDVDTGPADSELITKRQIFEKFRRRMLQMAAVTNLEFCAELHPDVIVIEADQSLLFEPQNKRASELLHRRCGLSIEGVQVRERIRVHPCQGRSLIDDLTIAGLRVV